MRLAEYCKSKGFNVDQYTEVKNKIEEEANQILEEIQDGDFADTGIFLPADWIEERLDEEYTPYLIQSLKKKHVEFSVIEDPLVPGKKDLYYRY